MSLCFTGIIMWQVIIDELHQIKFISPRVTVHITTLIKYIYKLILILYINFKRWTAVFRSK